MESLPGHQQKNYTLYSDKSNQERGATLRNKTETNHTHMNGSKRRKTHTIRGNHTVSKSSQSHTLPTIVRKITISFTHCPPTTRPTTFHAPEFHDQPAFIDPPLMNSPVPAGGRPRDWSQESPEESPFTGEPPPSAGCRCSSHSRGGAGGASDSKLLSKKKTNKIQYRQLTPVTVLHKIPKFPLNNVCICVIDILNK